MRFENIDIQEERMCIFESQIFDFFFRRLQSPAFHAVCIVSATKLTAVA